MSTALYNWVPLGEFASLEVVKSNIVWFWPSRDADTTLQMGPIRMLVLFDFGPREMPRALYNWVPLGELASLEVVESNIVWFWPSRDADTTLQMGPIRMLVLFDFGPREMPRALYNWVPLGELASLEVVESNIVWFWPSRDADTTLQMGPIRILVSFGFGPREAYRWYGFIPRDPYRWYGLDPREM